MLGPRLVEASQALLELSGRDPVRVLGSTDAMKLRSSMTLFEAAAPDERVFGEVLERYFGGGRDEATTTRL